MRRLPVIWLIWKPPTNKRLDVAPSFQAELGQALNGQNPSQIADVQPHLEADREAIANTRDGNTVQLETELTQLNKNFSGPYPRNPAYHRLVAQAEAGHHRTLDLIAYARYSSRH